MALASIGADQLRLAAPRGGGVLLLEAEGDDLTSPSARKQQVSGMVPCDRRDGIELVKPVRLAFRQVKYRHGSESRRVTIVAHRDVPVIL